METSTRNIKKGSVNREYVQGTKKNEHEKRDIDKEPRKERKEGA